MVHGLQCQTLAGTVPEVMLTLSPRLLETASQLQAATRAAKAQRPRRAPRRARPNLARVAALLPDEVSFRQLLVRALHAWHPGCHA